MCQTSSYQIFDRSPISAVTIEVTLSKNCSNHPLIMTYLPHYNCAQSIYDVNDFIVPATENSAVTITTRIEEVSHTLRRCDNSSRHASMYVAAQHQCTDVARCIFPPSYRDVFANKSIVHKPQLCWYRLPAKQIRQNYQVLDYMLFIKYYVEFPQLGLVRSNLIRDKQVGNYTITCEYDPIQHPYCPRFRILKILEMIEKDPAEYKLMFRYGSLIEIRISWKCNLDKSLDLCKPHYQFERLDHKPFRNNPYQLGSSFLTSRHYFSSNDSELHRVHATVYNLHIVVSVTGEVGKRDLFQMTTSIGSFIGIFGAGTIVCDLIAAFFTNFKSIKYDG